VVGGGRRGDRRGKGGKKNLFNHVGHIESVEGKGEEEAISNNEYPSGE
jgi:hypothetical protein